MAFRLSGKNGPELIQLSGSTIRNVTQGIIGVAVIQSLLSGMGLLVTQVPHAGLWSFLTLIVCIIQLPILVVLGPISIYLFFFGTAPMAVGFLIWAIILSIVDNPLRAFFFSRGSKTPMPIVFFWGHRRFYSTWISRTFYRTGGFGFRI